MTEHATLTPDALANQLDQSLADMHEALGTLPAELMALQQRIEAIKGPYQYQIDTIKTLLMQALVATGADKAKIEKPRFTFSVFSVARWNKDQLDAMVDELPQIVQARQITQQCQLRVK